MGEACLGDGREIRLEGGAAKVDLERKRRRASVRLW